MVELHPINQLAMQFYAQCCALTPPLALALDDLGWHPDKGLLGRQLSTIVKARGAPWWPRATEDAEP